VIRFIDLGDQILEGQREFAWWHTITDLFRQFNYNESWETWEDFAEDYLVADAKGLVTKATPLSRFKSLFPKEWP